MNVRRLLCLSAVVWLVGCGKSEQESAAPATAEAAPPAVEAVPSAPAPPAPALAPPKPALVLTPELEGAAVVVRVAVAGTLMREQTGVILQPEVFSPPIPQETLRRYVATLLPGHEEAMLRDKNCKIMVLRRRLDAKNNAFVMMRPALLVHFDAASHVAVLQFTENFAYRLEEGPVGVGNAAAAANADTGAAGVSLLQAIVNQDQLRQTAALPRAYEGTGLTGVVDVSLLRAQMADGGLRLAAGQTQAPGPVANAASRLNVAAVLSSDGSLLGFAKPAATAELRGLERFVVPQVAELDLNYGVVGVELLDADAHSKTLGYFRVRVKGVLKDPLKEYRSSRLALRNLAAPEDFTPVADLQANQPAMEHDGDFAACHMEPDMSYLLSLQIPPGAESSSQVVQVEMLRVSGEVAFRTAPFMVVTKRRGAGLYQSLAGVPAPASVAPAAMPGQVELTAESRILLGVPICEGREVLLKLEGAPHWKRLSLAERKWLPLPVAEEELRHCMLAGNKDALFVLDTSTAEIRRYNAETLALEKTARLPGGISYQSLAAGCLTDDAPLAVLGNLGALACDPRELTVKLSPNLKGEHDGRLSGKDYYLASGDGSVMWGKQPGEREFRSRFMYAGVMSGFSKEVGNFEILAKMGSQPTVALSVPWVNRSVNGDNCTPLTTSACYYTVSRARNGKDGIPTAPPQCSFYSFYADAPWATVNVPEAADVPLTAWGSFHERVWLDTTSMTFALWHADKTITLRTLDKAALPQPPVPVLLNYPDCYVSREGSFHFKPQVLGGSGDVSVAETPKGFTMEADGTMAWQPQGAMLGRQVGFVLQLAGSTPGQGAQIRLQLGLGGLPSAVAVPASLSGDSAETAVADMGNGKAAVPLVPLTSHFYSSERPILAVQPGLNDYLGLLLVDRTLVLLSLKDWKEAGSHALGTSAAAFLAGDVVFIYNSITREVTRNSLPDFSVTHRQALPSGARLVGLGVGEKPVGPLTLVLEAEVKTPARGVIPAGTAMERSILILDKETLDPARWAAYKPKKDESKKDLFNPQPHLANFFHDKELPVQVPTSADGRLVSFGKGLLMISPALTVDFFYRTVLLGYHQLETKPLATTPTADRLFLEGQMYLSADLPAIKICDGRSAALSRCGNYVAWLKIENDGRKQIRLSSANDGRPLLGLAGVELLKLHDGEEQYQRQVLMPRGDKNLLTVLSRGGLLLQGIDLDLAATFLALEPQSAYVTSHPFPIVAEGRTLDYQVTVSNPAAVSRYELRDRTPGAIITPQGHLSYRAPSQLKQSQQETIAIVIHFKSGEVALHQVPVYVIAVGAAAKSAAK